MFDDWEIANGDIIKGIEFLGILNMKNGLSGAEVLSGKV